MTSEGAYGPLDWKTSTGEDRYRRGLYTFSKRTAPYAMFVTFDAPSGEACLARREVSNTPLQALTLLNDTVYMETAQALGRRLADRQASDEDRLKELFLRTLARPPAEEERSVLLRFLASNKARLSGGELKATEIAGVADGDVVSRAAWTLLARTVLNLDEFVTKE